MKTQNTLIAVQNEYIETINLGVQRWGHRKGGGHASRIQCGARRRAAKKLGKLGFTPIQTATVLRDAHEMAALLRNADELGGE